jgi:hypothetical protein
MDGAGVARIAQWSAVGQVRRVSGPPLSSTETGPTPIERRRRYIEGQIHMPHRFAAERSFEDEPGGVIE